MHDLWKIKISLKEKMGPVLVAGKDGLMNGPVYAVLAVIQRLVRMSLVADAKMEIVIDASMQGNYGKRL